MNEENVVKSERVKVKRLPCRSGYLSCILDEERLRVVVKGLVWVIKERVGVDNFDAIVYRGMSGAGVATTLGYLFRKPLVMVRKPGVESHSGYLVEGAMNPNRVLVVDDCISTGATIIETVKAVKDCRQEMAEGEFKVVAVVLYNDCGKNYHLLTGEEMFEDRFKTIITGHIRHDKNNRSALEATVDMKVYGFMVLGEERRGVFKYRMVKGNNLNID